MAEHVREAIRKGVVGVLNANNALPSGVIVETNRTTAISESERPAVIVTSGQETIEANVQVNGGAQSRTYTLLISAVVSNNNVVEDTLDDLILAIEKAVYGWDYRSVSTDIQTVNLIDIQQLLSDSSSQFIGTAILSYDITYRVRGNIPEITNP